MNILDDIIRSWNDQANLSKLTLEIIREQLRLAEDISSASISKEQSFLDEMDEGGSISRARARAKTITGGVETKYKYQFEALSNLLTIVLQRITFLQPLAHQSGSLQPNVPLPDPQAIGEVPV